VSTGSVPLFPTSRKFGKGDVIGKRYRLVRQIGEGAMGTVWVAHNELLDIDVAIKLLRVDNRKADPTRLYKRLLREARAAARLGHPGIVRVFDFGQTDDKAPYIVMELLEGESLADLLARVPRMDVIPGIKFILPVIDALAMAHGRGIIHRDIKPENIFLSKDEYGRMQPKIVDFGVARFAEAGRSLTRSGALLGTPDYMSPEQARGEPEIDHRVDIWALSIVIYELITGRRPFARDATNYLAVLRAIVHEPAPPILNFGVGDPALWLIIERGLKKRAKDRWETVRVLGEALALWLYERGEREDAIGASLKTTWLQSGFDGVKIEAASIPPPPSSKAPASGPRAEIDVRIEPSVSEDDGGGEVRLANEPAPAPQKTVPAEPPRREVAGLPTMPPRAEREATRLARVLKISALILASSAFGLGTAFVYSRVPWPLEIHVGRAPAAREAPTTARPVAAPPPVVSVTEQLAVASPEPGAAEPAATAPEPARTNPAEARETPPETGNAQKPSAAATRPAATPRAAAQEKPAPAPAPAPASRPAPRPAAKGNALPAAKTYDLGF
jgi:serine/threonine-protein kinase